MPLHSPGQLAEWPIFILQCRPQGHDSEEEWDMAKEQLHQCLAANTNHDCLRLYGAVALGTRAQIYYWERAQDTQNRIATITMRPIHPGILDISTPQGRRPRSCPRPDEGAGVNIGLNFNLKVLNLVMMNQLEMEFAVHEPKCEGM
ncbi:hypothetical protein B0I35DRAFT_194761 [Stachybotrys elegans]|uniref:Uncharacterized protein n=1 Tax=Stachybotrys elegans TaxID=80388 RepID=A0A8K0WUK3_9HYPO|nr:hypothetical protein B0I35DRAFT_194761 [Stachybotrys elegans]